MVFLTLYGHPLSQQNWWDRLLAWWIVKWRYCCRGCNRKCCTFILLLHVLIEVNTFSFQKNIDDASGNDAGPPGPSSPIGRPGSPSIANSGSSLASAGGACSSGSGTSSAGNMSTVTVDPDCGLTQTNHSGSGLTQTSHSKGTSCTSAVTSLQCTATGTSGCNGTSGLECRRTPTSGYPSSSSGGFWGRIVFIILLAISCVSVHVCASVNSKISRTGHRSTMLFSSTWRALPGELCWLFLRLTGQVVWEGKPLEHFPR